MADELIIKSRYSRLDVNIEFIDEINLMSNFSGTGKTFMFTIIKEYCRDNGIKCIYCDYSSVGQSEEQILQWCKDADIVIFDNADLYLTPKIVEKLKNAGKMQIISIKAYLNYNMRYAGVYDVIFTNDSLITKRRG